jgi:hypothetical protein
MFSLWFSIIGLIFGLFCSFKAKEKNRATQEWFVLGFIFSFLALVILSFLPAVNHELNNNEIDPEGSYSYLI